jgi:hypothetical protein
MRQDADVKPFLLLATRAEDAVADAEYDAFRRFGGLEAGVISASAISRIEGGYARPLVPHSVNAAAHGSAAVPGHVAEHAITFGFSLSLR